MAREDPQLKLRLTEEMKARITAAAKANGRSVNAEIVARLEASINPSAEVDELTHRLDEERRAFSRMVTLHESAIDVVQGYRTILQTANRQLLQYVKVARSLANIILNLDGAPEREYLAMAEKIEAHAKEAADRLQENPSLQQAKDELDETGLTIERASELLEKIKKL